MGVIFPGLGQLYNGRLVLAAIILLLIFASHCLIAVQSENLPVILILINIGIYVLAFFYAMIRAGQLRDGYISKKTNNWIFYMIFLMVGIILTSLPGQFLYTFYRVPANDCMGDKYAEGDVLYASRLAYMFDKPKQDDIVVFRVPSAGGMRSIGRVWAEGEREIVVRSNAVFLDGYEILSSRPKGMDIPRISDTDSEIAARDTVKTVRIPEGSYLIIGDNSMGWADMTCCGVFAKSLIQGKVDYVFYSSPPEDAPPRADLKLLLYYLFLQ